MTRARPPARPCRIVVTTDGMMPGFDYLCECGNVARYYVCAEAAPRYCGICDILHNGGRGKRADER